MSNRTANTAGFSKIQLIVFAIILVVLFIVGFRLTALISGSNGSSSEPVAAPSANTGGVGIVTPPKHLTDFTLTSKTGDPIRLSDLRGRPVVMFFGYTNCPDVCPTTLADYKQVKQLLGAQADDVSFVFISVDGKRDTPDQVKSFLDMFAEDFVGMTGDAATLRNIGTEYGLVFAEERVNVANTPDGDHQHGQDTDGALDQENYFVQHTSPSFLIDREGSLRMVDFYGTKPETMADGIRQLLQESAQ